MQPQFTELRVYAPSIGNQAYTIAVWMFADWIGRNPHVRAKTPEQSPPTWTQEQWEQAVTLEDALRLFGGDDESDDLRAIKNETPAAIRKYVGENESEMCRVDDGILRRFPDQLIQILLTGQGDVRPDAAGAMADALEIVRNIRRGSWNFG